MMDQYDRLYEQLEELIPGLTDLQLGDSRRSEAPGFMDLHLDVVSRTEEELRIALAHNYRQNGDTIADPDMEIRVYLIDGWKKAEALTYQDATRYDMVYPEANLVIPRLKKSLNSFLAQWLKNLKNQGHRLPPEEAKPRRPRGGNDCNEFKWPDVEEDEFNDWPGPMSCANCKHALTPECPYNFRK